MTPQELRKIHRQVDESGPPQDRKRALQSAVSLLEHEIQRLEDEKAACRMVFHRKLAAWWSTPVAADQVPFTISEDRRAEQLYRIAAIACVTCEALLGAWICLTLGLPWWIGVLVAVLGAIIFHGGFSLAFRQVDRPKETLGKLKRWILWPSIAVFGISFTLFLLARTIPGKWAVALAPVFGLSLWTTTLGVLLLSAALLAAAHVVGWSHKDSQEYTALDREQCAAKLYRDEFQNELDESAPAAAAPVTVRGASS